MVIRKFQNNSERGAGIENLGQFSIPARRGKYERN
jgi:hypothetical protein